MGNVLTTAGALTVLSDFVLHCMEIISENQMLFVLWCASLFFVGIGIVKALKKAAKK